ncbi:uncharacterized protein B0I36DRAFT_347132 [Microdochium trichocladiopsis]|uniref:Uncharacterized protein n=1 Tax=Microdochium trichocladiopsis TaxID=1682393 RepID=A0A9P8YC48_9PEZI|nr:uncharacterized protein B0I36DRAFT_347132 [Microdochium trichocladiopsis]KAH7035334.1 hypothetical protein B0I36DRAFT_347132 [Microdochium trichocladiopsis]
MCRWIFLGNLASPAQASGHSRPDAQGFLLAALGDPGSPGGQGLPLRGLAADTLGNADDCFLQGTRFAMQGSTMRSQRSPAILQPALQPTRHARAQIQQGPWEWHSAMSLCCAVDNAYLKVLMSKYR